MPNYIIHEEAAALAATLGQDYLSMRQRIETLEATPPGEVDTTNLATKQEVEAVAEAAATKVELASLAEAVVVPSHAPLSAASRVLSTWARPVWTDGEVYNPLAFAELPDHTKTIEIDPEGREAVRFDTNGQLTAKTVFRRPTGADILLTARLIATGMDGGSQGYLGLYRGADGSTSGTRTRTGTVLVDGLNLLTLYLSKSSLNFQTLVRPFVRRTGAVGTVHVQFFDIIEVF